MAESLGWRVAIAGVGLIGASLGLDLRQKGHTVLGLDESPAHLEQAIAIGAVQSAIHADLPEVDVAILAAPPLANLRLLRLPWRARLVMDTSSVKEAVVGAAIEAGLPFVGGHPIAGSEGGGPGAARPGLFTGRTFVLTPAGGPLELAQAVVRAVGAVPRVMDPRAHDLALARTSHLTYLLSCALAKELGPIGPELMGPAAYEMLRVATSPTGMWQEILMLNQTAVSQAARDFAAELARLAQPQPDLDTARKIAEQTRRIWHDAR